MLAHYDPNLPIEVRVDASGLAIGGVLAQQHKDGWHPVAYMSKLLNETQRKYAITEKECFSMVYAVEYFRPYLEHQEFVIVTDHCALCWLKTKDKLTSKLERWATILQGFNYTVRYKSGKVHKDADCLSRNYLSLPVPELNETNLFAYANIEFGVSYIGQLQRKDLAIERIRKELLKYASKGIEIPLRLQKFKIINDRVYRVCNSQLGKYYTIYVPKKLRAEVCYNNHDDPLAGHCGINKTYDRIKDKYYWPGMLQYITNYVKSCINCLHRKTPKTAPAGLLQPIPVEAPFKRVGIDVIVIVGHTTSIRHTERNI